jgi:hypothetical protein
MKTEILLTPQQIELLIGNDIIKLNEAREKEIAGINKKYDTQITKLSGSYKTIDDVIKASKKAVKVTEVIEEPIVELEKKTRGKLDEAKVLEMYKAGTKVYGIVKELKSSTNTVKAVLIKNGLLEK